MSSYFETSWYHWLKFSSFTIAAFVMVIIVIIHSYNVISDLCTKNRKSINHQRIIPNIDFNYILSTMLSYICIISYMIAIVLNYILTQWTSSSCKVYVAVSTAFYLTAKTLTYLILIHRLHSVYKHSAHRYNPKLLLFIASLNIIHLVLIIIACIFLGKVNPHSFKIGDYSGIFCNVAAPIWVALIIGIYNVIMCLLCLIAFLRPLKSVILASDQLNKTSQKMIKAGTKARILTVTAVLSTLIAFILLSIANSSILLAIDTVINIICICLMTPYYKYYDKICCLCIMMKCCKDQWLTTKKQSTASSSDIEQTGLISNDL